MTRLSSCSHPVFMLAIAGVFCSQLDLTYGQEATKSNDKVVANDPAVAQAALAFQLAVQGEKAESPILMLAASEILGSLKTKESPKDVVRALEGEKETSSSKPTFSISLSDWEDKARQFAKGDKELESLVEKYLESTRGLINKPAGALDYYIGTSRYAIVDSGFIPAGDALSLSNLQLDATFATVAVVADIGGEFVMSVSDSRGNTMGGPSFRGFGIVSWSPQKRDSYTLRVQNSGGAISYVVLAN